MAETGKGKEITVLPLEPGAVTTLNGTTITAVPLGGQPVTGTVPPYGLNTAWAQPGNWSNPPVVMIPPQQPLILVVADNKKDESPKEKQHSRVFTRL